MKDSSCHRGHNVSSWSGCGPQSESGRTVMDQDRLLVEERNASFMTAFKKGDMQAIANMYAEGADLLPPNAEMVRGRSGIEAFWRKIAEAIDDLRLTTI